MTVRSDTDTEFTYSHCNAGGHMWIVRRADSPLGYLLQASMGVLARKTIAQGGAYDEDHPKHEPIEWKVPPDV